MYAPQSMKVVGDRGLFRTSFGRKRLHRVPGDGTGGLGHPASKEKPSMTAAFLMKT